jgi:CDP-diacylglycerol--serine O-phosphatidyltransferase
MPPLLAGIIAFTPILFGTIRLARFNLLQDDNPTPYFIGIPTPLAALGLFSYSLFSLSIYGHPGDPRIGLFMAVILGAMMISPIRFGKFPILSFKVSSSNSRSLLGVLITLIAILIWKGTIIFPLFLLYVTWSIVNWMIYPQRFEVVQDDQSI